MSDDSTSPAPEHRTLGMRILRAGAAVGIAHVCLKLALVLQVMVLSWYLPAGTYDVVYAFAFEGCLFSLFLIGEEVIGPSFLPVFMREKDERGEPAAWAFANVILTAHFLLLVLAVLGIVLFPSAVVRLFTAWSAENEPEKFELARRSLVWLAPALVGLSLASTTYMILNGYKRFFLAAFGDASWKICVLIAVGLGMGVFGVGIRSLIFGLLVGSAAKLFTHLVGLVRELRHFRPSLRLSNPAVRAMMVLMLPLVAGIILAKVRDVYNNVTILSHLHAEGLLQANSLGRKLYSSVGWLVPYALSIAMFPFFCELVDRNDVKKLGEVLTHSARLLLAVFIPFALVCLVMAYPISSFLFQAGRFGPEMVSRTAVSTACYTLVLPAFAVEYLLMQAFFANRRMVSITVVGVIFSVLTVAISYVGIKVCGATGLAALAVVALGMTVARTLKVVTLVVVLRRFVPAFPWRETAGILVKATLTGAVAAGACAACDYGFTHAISAGAGKSIMLLRLAADGAAAAAGFAAGALIFRLREPAEMLRWAAAKLRGRRPQAPLGEKPADGAETCRKDSKTRKDSNP